MKSRLTIFFTVIIAFILLGRLPEGTVSAFDRSSYIRYGKASWYSRHDPGVQKTTANNEPFNDQAMTCAMWGVGFNQKVRVTNLANNRSVVLRVNDRGPHERFIREGRVIDLTKSAFAQLSPNKEGIIEVMIEFLM